MDLKANIKHLVTTEDRYCSTKSYPVTSDIMFVIVYIYVSPKLLMHSEVGLWEGDWIMGLKADMLLGVWIWWEEVGHWGVGLKEVISLPRSSLWCLLPGLSHISTFSSTMPLWHAVLPMEFNLYKLWTKINSSFLKLWVTCCSSNEESDKDNFFFLRT